MWGGRRESLNNDDEVASMQKNRKTAGTHRTDERRALLPTKSTQLQHVLVVTRGEGGEPRRHRPSRVDEAHTNDAVLEGDCRSH